jgi:hypothetical protein
MEVALGFGDELPGEAAVAVPRNLHGHIPPCSVRSVLGDVPSRELPVPCPAGACLS